MNAEVIAILPLGAHEQHGPHLPFDTDSVIASAIADRLVAAASSRHRLLRLPTEPVGYSPEHGHVDGTRTLDFDAAVHRWLSIAGDCSQKGIRKLLLLNAHGGNSPLLTIVATEARIRFRQLCVATSWTRFIRETSLVAPDEQALDIHAGRIETSVMLALEPNRVMMDKARHFPNRQAEFAARFSHLRAYGPHAFGWRMDDLSDDGATGRADAADASTGEALITMAVNGLAALIDDMAAFDLRLFDR